MRACRSIGRPPRIEGRSVQLLVGGDGEELDELVGQGDLLEQGPGFFRSTLGVEELVSYLLADLLQLLGGGLADQVGGDGLSLGQLDAIVDPLPDLGAGDLGGGRS
jgi:hypothetical protein